MISSEIKSLLATYKNLDLNFSFFGSQWVITVGNPDGNFGEYEKSVLTDEPADMYRLLQEIIPGIAITNYHDMIIGDDEMCCYSFERVRNMIVVYSGRVGQKDLFVSEIEFDNELDFYIYLFRNFPDILLSAVQLSDEGIKSPYDLLTLHLKDLGYSIKKFKHGTIDDEGYSWCAMVLEKKEGKFRIVEYPQKDAVYFNNDFANPEEVDFKSFTSDFLKILIAIEANNLDSYLEVHSWA